MPPPAVQDAVVVARIILAGRPGVRLEIHDDRTPPRDGTHVRDVVAPDVQASPAPGFAGEILNVACGEGEGLPGTVAAFGSS